MPEPQPYVAPGRQVQPSQGRAITALCLTIFGGCCFYIPAVVGAVMAVKVINESDDDSVDHGRGLAIGALGVAALHLATLTLALMMLVGGVFGWDSGRFGAEAGNADPSIVVLSDLHVQDCFDDPTLHGGRGPVRRVACGDAHDAEVMRSLPLADGQFPGLAHINERARECRTIFGDYVGKPLARSKLALTYYYPTRASWVDAASLTITCVVWNPRGQLEEFAAGSER
jgi:hypothetical protein